MKKSSRIQVILLAGFLTMLPNILWSQVANTKSKVRDDKEKSQQQVVITQPQPTNSVEVASFSEFWNPEGLAQTIAVYTVGAALYGVYYVARWGHGQTLLKQHIYPDRVSFEASANVLIDVTEGNLGYQPGVRLNWGLFAADVRYAYLEDYSGKLQSIDWQVPILRIPIKNFKLEYGIGGITILEPSRTYFESRVGIDWRLMNQRANIQTYYRWSQRTRLGGRYREEAALQFDYITHNWGKWRLAPMVGYTYQRYFGDDDLNFIKAGLVLRCF